MILPPLTPLQYLVTSLLFRGPKSGAEIRRSLGEMEIEISPSALSRLMTRLEWMWHIHRQYITQDVAGRNVRQCTFAVTDHGIELWNQTRQFYFELSPPAPDFVPYSDEETRKAHLTPEERNKELMQDFYKDFSYLFHR
jgi:DNA-binding PadR family transcriptional regulator